MYTLTNPRDSKLVTYNIGVQNNFDFKFRGRTTRFEVELQMYGSKNETWKLGVDGYFKEDQGGMQHNWTNGLSYW